MEKREFFGIHVVKATAIIFVFYFHFFYRTGYHDVEIFGWNLYLQAFFRWLTHICVPLFFLATGVLRAETGFSKKYYCGVFRIIFVYLAISVITALLRWLYVDQLVNDFFSLEKKDHLLDLCLGIFRFDTIGYGWYVPAFCALYLGIPVLNLIWKKLARPLFRALFVGWVALFMWLDLFDLSMHLYPVLFFLLGKIVREYRPKGGWIAWLWAAAFLALELLAAVFVTNFYPSHISYFDNYGSVLAVCFATSVFIGLYDIRVPKSRLLVRSAKLISCATFEIYLFAYLFDYTLYPLFGGWIRTVTQEAAFIFFPLVPPLSFLCALGAALLFRALFRLSRRPSRRLNYA